MSRPASVRPIGVVEEMVASDLADSRRRLREMRGTEPAKVLNIEQVQIVGSGHQVMLVLETPEGARAFVLDATDAANAARRLQDVAESASTGLFVAGS